MDNNNVGHPSATPKEKAAGRGKAFEPARAPRSASATSNSAHTAPILIDPAEVRPSKWHNRHESAYKSDDFVALVAAIRREGGNTIPIKVRPLLDGAGPSDQYEIVYGHRRHRACLELNLQVLASVEQLTDEQLVCAMHRENMNRKDLSPYERGVAYRHMLKEELFSNAAALGRELGVDEGDVSRMLFLAELPQEVIDILHSPLELTIHSVDKLRPAHKEDKNALAHRAIEIGRSRGRVSAKEAVSLLTRTPKVGASNIRTRPLIVAAREVGTLRTLVTRCVRVALVEPLTESAIDGLQIALQDFLSKHFVEHPSPHGGAARPP